MDSNRSSPFSPIGLPGMMLDVEEWSHAQSFSVLSSMCLENHYQHSATNFHSKRILFSPGIPRDTVSGQKSCSSGILTASSAGRLSMHGQTVLFEAGLNIPVVSPLERADKLQHKPTKKRKLKVKSRRLSCLPSKLSNEWTSIK